MSADREERLKMLLSEAHFSFAGAAQFVNGEGVTLMSLFSSEVQLTVGLSWLRVPIDSGRRGTQAAWILYTRVINEWMGGPAQGQSIDDEELQAIATCIKRAFAVADEYVNFIYQE